MAWQKLTFLAKSLVKFDTCPQKLVVGDGLVANCGHDYRVRRRK